jgi:hypothetical protein
MMGAGSIPVEGGSTFCHHHRHRSSAGLGMQVGMSRRELSRGVRAKTSSTAIARRLNTHGVARSRYTVRTSERLTAKWFFFLVPGRSMTDLGEPSTQSWLLRHIRKFCGRSFWGDLSVVGIFQQLGIGSLVSVISSLTAQTQQKP